MSNAEGPFFRVNFCGASVTSYSSNIGWNNDASSVNVNLVEDPDLNQRFTYPQEGTPLVFQFGGFRFEGLVQRYLKKDAIDGNIFEITLTDPREILAGTQIIIASYAGDVGNIANLINAFGYWENQLGFGGGLTNESGMVWNAPFSILGLNAASTTPGQITVTEAGPVGIMPAIHKMTGGARTPFGGPLKFHGREYKVDLSGLPLPPAYYRIGGVAVSLLDIVSQICEDGGHDMLCFLNGNTISFKTVSRVRQPDPGQIQNFVNSRTDATTKSVGIELRNDVTNAVLLGGDVTNLIQEYNLNGDTTIWPYWGMDFNGMPVWGQGRPEIGHTFNLNAAPIADIVGQLFYPCDIPELRCALMDYDSWAYYVLKWNPDKAKVLNLISAIDDQSNLNDLFASTILTRDLINDSTQAVNLYGPMNETDYWTRRAQRVYEFVRQYATEYFGRKFLVRIPFLIYYKTEPETTNIVKSAEPTDAAYLPEGTYPLGLQFINEAFFLTEDGRFQCFVKYMNVPNADVQKLSSDSVVFQGTDIYMKATVDTQIGVIFPPGSIYPYCVVNVDSAVFEQATDPLGNLEDVANLLDYNDLELLKFYAAGMRHDSFPIKIHPGPYRPTAVALPMKSNRNSYGPWFTSGGVDGKVSFERDEGLVPWNYGDINTMNQAAMAKLQNAATKMTFTETASVEIAGLPEHSLGDELIAGGPQLTSIDVSFGTGGITTTYRMQTFTPRFGQFSKDNADRLRRLGLSAMGIRRSIRNLFLQSASVKNVVNQARVGFMMNTSRAVRQQTPHQCLMSTMSWDDNYWYRTQVSSMTAPEVVANCRGDNDNIWPATAIMTMEGLLRPFSTNRNRNSLDPLGDMPHYETVEYNDVKISRAELDPFGEGHDIDFMAWGDTYPGRLHTLKAEGGDWENSRLLGLRGPLVMVGWGYTYTGKPFPNASSDSLPENERSDSFTPHHRSRMEEWKAGPVALYWDSWRKVWTVPTDLWGTLDADMTEEGVLMTIEFNGDSPADKVLVKSPLGGIDKLVAGTKVCASYYQQVNEWRIIAAPCL